MELVIVVAIAADGTIGDDGTIPWHHPADLRHFKETTMGAPVIMGRRTYEAIVDRLGHALPGRDSIVLTRQPAGAVVDEAHIPDDRTTVRVAGDLDAAERAAADRAETAAYVVGGRSVYEQFLPRVDRLVVTEIPGRYAGDTRFPAVDWDRWTEADRTTVDDLDVVEYVRA